MSAAVLAWEAPVLLGRLAGHPHAFDAMAHFERLVSFALVVFVCLVALATNTLGGRHRRWLTAITVALGAGALGMAWRVAHPDTCWRLLEAFADAWPFVGAMLAIFAVVVTMPRARRTPMSSGDLVLRAAVGASAIWCVGVWAGRLHFMYGYDGGPSPPELAACASAYSYPVRLAGGFVAAASVWTVLALRLRSRPRTAATLAPLVGLAIWLTTRATVDALAYRAADRICRPEHLAGPMPSPETLTHLATVAAVVGIGGTALAVAFWAGGLLRSILRPRAARASRVTWRRLWPLLPALVLTTSPAFGPPLVAESEQVRPEAVWQAVDGFEPLTRHAGDGTVSFETRGPAPIGLLDRNGDLHVFESRRRAPIGHIVLAPSSDYDDWIPIVVDRRATLGALRKAAEPLRRFRRIVVTWRSNDLHRTSTRARERWAFLEMASRSLKGQELALASNNDLDCGTARPERIHGALFRRCQVPPIDAWHPQVLVPADPDDTPLATWLTAIKGLPKPVALAVPPPPSASLHVVGRPRPPDPLTTRVLPPDLIGVPLGLLLAFALALFSMLRQLRDAQVQMATSRPAEVRAPSRRLRRVPTWVRPQRARLRASYRAREGAPYREGHPPDVWVADVPTSLRELRCAVCRALQGGPATLLGWLLVALLACAVGICLPAVLSMFL